MKISSLIHSTLVSCALSASVHNTTSATPQTQIEEFSKDQFSRPTTQLQIADLQTEQLELQTKHTQFYQRQTILEHSNKENTTCTQINPKHNICIQNHDDQVDTRVIINRYQELIKHTLEILQTPNASTSGFDYIYVASSQMHLANMMRKLDVRHYWGIFLEDLMQNNMNTVFCYPWFTDNPNQDRYLYANISHELAHAAFSRTIQNHKTTSKLLRAYHIDPRVIEEGFAEFILFANNLPHSHNLPHTNTQTQTSNIDLNITYKFPQIKNIHPTRNPKIYDITELLFTFNKPKQDNYYYGKILYSYLYTHQYNLLLTLLRAIKFKVPQGFYYFKNKISNPTINTEFRKYQQNYKDTHHKLNQDLNSHIEKVFANIPH